MKQVVVHLQQHSFFPLSSLPHMQPKTVGESAQVWRGAAPSAMMALCTWTM